MVVLTRKVGDKVIVTSDQRVVDKRYAGSSGIITSVHPASGCYTVNVGGKSLVFFEHELSSPDASL